MQIALKKYIDQNLPFLKDKKLLVAISGGIDSVVLTHLLYKLKYSVSLAHCNFSLRGKESNKDEQFVIALGKKLGVPTYNVQFETESYAEDKKISIQMAARELRYNWFQEIIEQQKLDFVLTAHHKEDVLETFIINLTRGTGLNGLTGIPEINGNLVRPILTFTRNEILVYATRNKLKWREDESNSSIKYVRNKIRHKVVPLLKELNPNLLDTFQHTIDHLKESQDIIRNSIRKIRQKITIVHHDEFHFDIRQLKELDKPEIYFFELLKDYGFTEWNDVTQLMDSQSGKKVISKTHQLLKNRDFLILSEISKKNKSKTFDIAENTQKIKDPITLKFETINIVFDNKKHQNKVLRELIFDDINTISVDFNALKFPLVLRKWRKGDYFYPIGLKGKKKLSKFFKDEKLSLLDKENNWLLCSDLDIVWVVGKRMDERFKVTKNTSKILKIRY